MNLHLQKRETRLDIFRSKFSTKLFSGKEVSVTINSVVRGISCQVSLWNRQTPPLFNGICPALLAVLVILSVGPKGKKSPDISPSFWM